MGASSRRFGFATPGRRANSRAMARDCGQRATAAILRKYLEPVKIFRMMLPGWAAMNIKSGKEMYLKIMPRPRRNSTLETLQPSKERGWGRVYTNYKYKTQMPIEKTGSLGSRAHHFPIPHLRNSAIQLSLCRMLQCFQSFTRQTVWLPSFV
jgi:hypothetical protein